VHNREIVSVSMYHLRNYSVDLLFGRGVHQNCRANLLCFCLLKTANRTQNVCITDYIVELLFEILVDMLNI